MTGGNKILFFICIIRDLIEYPQAVSYTHLLMTAFCMILTLPSLTSGRGWSDLDRIAADPDAAFQMQLVTEYIRSIPPWQASLRCV